MKKYLFPMLLLALFAVGFTASDEDLLPDENDTETPNTPGLDGKTSLIYLEDIEDYWDYAIIEDTSKYVCKKIIDDNTELALGHIDGKTVKLISDSQMRPISIECDEFKANVSYRGGKAFVYCQFKELMYCDSLDISDNQVITALINWAMDKGIRDGIENTTANVSIVKAIGTLLDYQRAIVYINIQGTFNYQVEKYKWADWLLRPSVVWCPIDWLKRVLNDNKDENIKNTEQARTTSTFIVGLVTGSAPYIYSESAKCLVDGYLQATANGGRFDFDYGICYSESERPTINDNVVSKNVKSGGSIGSSITLTLPEQFLLTNLKKNTKYYYRAYFRSNATGHVVYSERIRNFTTSDIPASISSFAQTNSYHNQNGYTHNGNTYSYKFMIALKAELESFTDVTDWGYYYINESGDRIAVSMMSRNALRCDDILEYYSNTPETTIELGCYVKYASIEGKVFYSEPQLYSLKYNDAVTLTFTDCRYITITHDNSLGYYRCGITFDVSFKIEGSQNLTSIVILPYGNFLAWNAPSYDNPSDGEYKATITDQYLYEYGLYGNFYCYLYAKDVDGKEYYSDNIIRLYHDGAHFTACVTEPWEALSPNAAARKNVSEIKVLRHE